MRTRINGVKNITHINSDTGEIICETHSEKESTFIDDGILTEAEKKQKEYEDTHVLNFNEGENFAKMFTEMMYKLSLHLPAKEYQVAIGLSNFVSYESCALKNGYGKSSHFMGLKEIADVMQLEYTRASRIISSLIKKGVIGLFKTGNIKTGKIKQYYIVNPYIYLNGKNPEKDIYDYFQNSGWKELLNEMNAKSI